MRSVSEDRTTRSCPRVSHFVLFSAPPLSQLSSLGASLSSDFFASGKTTKTSTKPDSLLPYTLKELRCLCASTREGPGRGEQPRAGEPGEIKGEEAAFRGPSAETPGFSEARTFATDTCGFSPRDACAFRDTQRVSRKRHALTRFSAEQPNQPEQATEETQRRLRRRVPPETVSPPWWLGEKRLGRSDGGAMDAARAAPRDRGRERNRRTRRVSAAPLARPSTAPYTESGPTRQGEETLPGTGYESAVGEPGGGEARRVDGERRPTERTRETAFAGEESEAERADPRASSTQSETPEATEEDREKGGRTATGDWPSSRDAQATWRLQPCRLASSSPVLACTSSPSAEPASSPSFASPAVSSWLFNGNATRWDEQRAFRHTRNLSGNPVVFASPSDSDDERGSRPSQALSLSSLSPSERTAGASKSDGARLARAVSRPTAGPQPFEEFIQACCLPCCFPPRNPPPAAPQAASLSCCVCSSLVPSPPSASSRFPVSSPVASAGTRASPTSSLAPRGRKREPAGAQIEGKDRRTREEERASEACAETQAQPVGLTLLLRLIQFLTVKDFLNLSSVSVSLRRLLLSRTVSERCYFLFLLQDCLPSGFHSLHTCSTSRSSSTPHALSASSSAPQALSASSSAPQALSASSSLPASPSSSVSPGLPPLSPPFLALARASTAPLVFSYKGILQQRMRAQRAWLLPRPFLHEFFLSHPGPSLQDADAAADAGIEIQRSVSDEPSTPGRGKTCRSSARAWSASGRPLSPSVAETQLTAVAFSCSTPQSPCVPLVAATDSTNSCLLSKLGGSLQIPSSRSSFFHLLPALHSSDAPPSSGRPSDGGYSLAASWWTSSLEFLPSSPYLVAAQQHSGVCASLSDSLSAVHPCVSVYDLSSPLQHLASCTGEEGARHAQERAAREEEGYRTLPARKTVRLQAADRRNAKACACTSCWVVDTGLGDACGEATPPATGDSDASEETGRDGEKEGEQRARDHAVRSSCSHRMWALMSCGMAIALDLHRCEVVSRLSPGSPSSVSDSGAKARGCRVLPLSAASGVFTARGEEVAVVVESRGVFFCDSRLPNSLPFVLFSRAHAGREGGAAAQTLREDRPIAAACTGQARQNSLSDDTAVSRSGERLS
ncbi:conserved hypothetical protein [Neospora caninum Liverpool]|uniref:F-box domain-containing protein n=1 Tax=Neospora caninum (strain Liverpool) TaxID=572307 RepID=F0VRF1_NEOCL|nr:conserved hypothetical protein [Neospora caninum Liverpool]CBZ56299.1 conserved hypothetical protein [Neospora caninum Liverpool]CEL71061.1 TPA: hypothetical protein BN1204_067240 [Neospora caninum Liverpool]|eukprot:XP_003886324.1 conserved hypothetical protein [Neospora caninum Liverpool]